MYFEDFRESLINLPVCYVYVMYGSKLRVGIGEKQYNQSIQRKDRLYAEWDILAFSGWRVLKDEKLLCGYDDEIKDCNAILERSKYGILVDVIRSNEYDIRLCFDSGLVVDFLFQSTSSPSLTAMCRNKKVEYELTVQGWTKLSSVSTSEKLNAVDATLKSHSKECHERWRHMTQESESCEKCQDCFYFRGIYGGFYFWEYGLCSNEKSEYDGRLVHENSGRSNLATLSDLTDDTSLH